MLVNKAIIIGAPRSGTNMIRDVLSQLEGVGTWPCDEINYIWRHGNTRFPTDAFTEEMATGPTVRYIRKQFQKIARSTSSDLVLEKTCANSLRVPFLNAVFPDSKFIFIVRDGLDVAGSASLRWRAKLDIPYLLQKTRFVPPSDLPYYASRYFGNRIRKIFSKEKRVSFWGPSTEKMPSWLHEHTLNEVCALQWRACVESSEKALSSLDPKRLIRVKYENFVTNPREETERIASFLNKELNQVAYEQLSTKINAKSVGKGRASLSNQEVKKISLLISHTLSRYGYAC